MKARTAVIGSLVLHGGLLAALGGGGLWAPEGAPPPVRTLRAEIPAESPLEDDPPPLPLDAPEETALPPGSPDLLEPPPMGEDPRFADADEPPGPPAEIIGVSSIEGIRRGRLDGSGSGHGTGRGRGRAEPGPPPVVEPPPPAPDPVFLPPSLKADRVPTYPPALRRAGVEGTVRVRVAVGADGSVGDAEVAESSGHAALDEAAVEAARQWAFLPATEDGKPVASVVYRYVFFKLTDAR